MVSFDFLYLSSYTLPIIQRFGKFLAYFGKILCTAISKNIIYYNFKKALHNGFQAEPKICCNLKSDL